MPLVHIKTKRLEYKFELERKFNFILGDSGTGKTTLVTLVEEYGVNKRNVQISGYAKLVALPSISFESTLSSYKDYIIFIDEDNPALRRKDIAALLQDSNNYFVIVTRHQKFGYLPVDGRSFYRIKTSGSFHTLESLYQNLSSGPCTASYAICEDSKSGRSFLKQLLPASIEVAELSDEYKNSGRSTLSVQLENAYQQGYRNVLLTYDLVGIGHDYFRLADVLATFTDLKVTILDWDSFEGYIFQSPLIGGSDVIGLVNNIEKEYTKKLHEALPKYSKENLALCLRISGCTSCTDAYGCQYMHTKMDRLIYGQLQKILNSAKLSMCEKENKPVQNVVETKDVLNLKQLTAFSDNGNK